MPASNLTLNPYRPPRAAAQEFPWVELNPAAALQVVDVHKDFLFREVLLSGFLETKIAWDARGSMECVRVAGKKVAGQLSWWGCVPRFDFSLPTLQGSIPASIDVRVAWLLVTREFRLTINDFVVYEEL